MEFRATVFSATKQDGYFMAAFGDDEYEPLHYLILQRDFEERDGKVQCTEKEYVEVDSDDNAGYGLVEKARYDGAALLFHIKKLGEVRVRLDEVEIDAYSRDILAQILAGKLKRKKSS